MKSKEISYSTRLVKLFNPMVIFVSIWLILILFYSLRISEFYPDPKNLYLVCGVSIIFYLLGSIVVIPVFLRKKKDSQKYLNYSFQYKINPDYIYYVLILIALFIMVYNYINSGNPPILGKFGFQAKVYAQYGRFKGVLFPIGNFFFIMAFYEKKKSLRFTMLSLSVIIFISYIARGPLLLSMVQLLLFKLYTTKKRLSLRKIVLFFVLFLFVISATMSVLGDIRTGNENFKQTFQIRDEYYDWPSGVLWTVSYIAAPSANLVSYIENIHEFNHGFTFQKIFPAFVKFNNNYDLTQFNPEKQNTAGTYLSHIYADYSWGGVMVYNFLLGLISMLLYYKLQKKKKIFYFFFYIWMNTAIVFLFFGQFILFFQYLFEIILFYIFCLNIITVNKKTDSREINKIFNNTIKFRG